MIKCLRLAVCACILAAPAFAGEKYLGTIAGTTGPTSKNNHNTATPFKIPPMAKVTVQCDAAAYIATDVITATSTNGVKVSADSAFPTSVGVNLDAPSTDAGVSAITNSAVISVIGVSGAANCKVFERRGSE